MKKVLVARATFPDIVDRLRQHFEVDLNERDVPFSYEELVARIDGKDGAMLMGGERIDAALLDRNPQLAAVCNCAAGYDNFDMDAITSRGVIATNTPVVSNESVADFAWTLMLAAARRTRDADLFVRSGHWRGFAYNLMLGHDVHGTTLGIIGMGRIGQAIARRARGFGMTVLYNNRNRLSTAIEEETGSEFVDRDELLSRSDHVVLALSQSADSRHLIGASELERMKPTATLVNIARGGIVDDAALADALARGIIAGAALDVFEGEPNVVPELLDAPNVLLTPHMASASVMTRRALADLAVDNLIASLGEGPRAGTPPSILNPEVLEGRIRHERA